MLARAEVGGFGLAVAAVAEVGDLAFTHVTSYMLETKLTVFS